MNPDKNKIFAPTSPDESLSAGNHTQKFNSNDMINSIKIILVILSLFPNAFVKADWAQVNNGLGILNVNALCSYTSNGVNYIFAGTLYGGGNSGVIFVSTNDGNNWSISWNIPNDVWTLANSGNYVYAGTGNGLGYTTNNGMNWLDGGLGHTIYSLTANGSNVFAGCKWRSFDPGGVYKSTNNGANWTQTSLPACTNGEYTAMAINGNNVYTSGFCGTFLSTDFGLNWIQSSTNVGAHAFAIYGNNIFAGDAGVYKSTDNGINWVRTSLDSNVIIYAMLIYSNEIFVGGGGGFFISLDNGTNWQPKFEGLGGFTRSLCISNAYIFDGTDGHGIYRRPLSELVGIKIISQQVPTSSELKQNYPNPFNPTTSINYQIITGSIVKINIYNIIGQEITTLVNQKQNPGSYETSWDGINFPSGVYFYRLIADNKIIDTKKMILTK
jgi:hypothetical protein